MRLFLGGDLRQHLDAIKQKLKHEVYSESDNRLLNVDSDEYLDYLVSNYFVEPLDFQYDQLSASTRDEMIPAEHFPSNFHVNRGKSYQRSVITFHLPFSGDFGLLSLTPSQRIVDTKEVNASPGLITFDVIDFDYEPEHLKGLADNVVKLIKTQSEYVNQEVKTYNDTLKEYALQTFKARKEELLKKAKKLAALGVPIQKRLQRFGPFLGTRIGSLKSLTSMPHTLKKIQKLEKGS